MCTLMDSLISSGLTIAVQGVPGLLPSFSWDSLQPPRGPLRDKRV